MAPSISSESCPSRERGCPPFLRNAFPIAASIVAHGFGREGRWHGAFFPRTSRERAPPADRFSSPLIFSRTPRGRALREKVRGVRISVAGGVASVFVSDMFFGAYRWRWNALRMASSTSSESRLSRKRGCPPFLQNAFPIAAPIAGARVRPGGQVVRHILSPHIAGEGAAGG